MAIFLLVLSQFQWSLDVCTACAKPIPCLAITLSTPEPQKDKSTKPTFPLTPVSGDDGPFQIVTSNGVRVCSGTKGADGNYAPYMYFRVPRQVPKIRPVYVVVAYRDAGLGRLGLEYNAVKKEDYRSAEQAYGVWQTGQSNARTAVFQLTVPDFRHAQNVDADLRFVNPDSKAPLQIISVTLHLEPTPQFAKAHVRPWLQ